MKRLIPYLLFTSLLVYLFVALVFASDKMEKTLCGKLQVRVVNLPENSFVDEAEVEKMIRNSYGEVLNTKLTRINKDSLERILEKNPVVESVEVYYSLSGKLHVDIMQREPVLRIMADKGYYVDREGEVMPLSDRFTSRVMVATGSVKEAFARKQLAPFAVKLKEDAFWNAYVEQLVVLPNEEVVMIPKVGNFKISLGTLDQWEEKLDKLMFFLREGLPRAGWDRYKEIKLRYKDQIVCVKK